MGRIIRHTVTITITESWTIVWTDNIRADEPSPPPATTIVPDQRKTKKEPDATILPAVTTGAGMDTQPTDGSPKSSSQRKRRRRAAG